MKITAQKDYLEKVVDIADYASEYYDAYKRKGREIPKAKGDWITSSQYFSLLVIEAMDDEEFAEELEETLAELRKRAVSMKGMIVLLGALLRVVRGVRFSADDAPTREDIEKRFDKMMDRTEQMNVGEAKEKMLKIIQKHKKKEKKDRKKSTNSMYG